MFGYNDNDILERYLGEKDTFTGEILEEASLVDRVGVDYNSIYRSPAFLEAMTYFVNEDANTRKILLSVNEADQNVIMTSLATKLYSHIINKVDSIDFGTIPNTRGNVQKLQNYSQIRDCLDILGQILQSYNQPMDLVDTVTVALDNIVDRRELFMRAYTINAELPIVTYNSMVLSVVSAVSLLISSHIEFIKAPGNSGYNIAFDKTSKVKTKDSLLFKQLESFNRMCASGEFDKTIEYAIKNTMVIKAKKESTTIVQNDTPLNEDLISIGSMLTGASAVLSKAPIAGAQFISGLTGKVAAVASAHPVIASIATIFLALLLLIALLRAVIFYFYYMRTKLSDYLDLQSGLLYMNATNIENNLTRDDKEKSKIANNQKKMAAFLKKASEAIKVKERVAEQKADNDISRLNNYKFEINDVIGNDVPSSAASALF